MDKTMMLKEVVRNYICQHKMIEENDTIIAGVSGGADSVCLLFLLKEIQHTLPFELIAVHVEHGIRGEASKRDELFVKQLCTRLEVTLKIYEVDVPALAKEKRLSMEEAGRYARYQAFRAVASEYTPAKIAVAHHINDQAETVLFHMIRGSGIKGLGGMQPVRGDIIRPLLCINREEIEQYLKNRGASYCTDATNQDLIYSRNIIRNKAIPALEEVQDQAVMHIAGAAEELREAEEYIGKRARMLYDLSVREEEQGCYIGLAAFYQDGELIRRYVIKAVLEHLLHEWKDITRTHINDILNLCEKPVGKGIHLPKGIKAVRLDELLYIGYASGQDEKETEKKEISVNINGKTEIEEDCYLLCSILTDEKKEDIPRNTYTKWFDYDKIKDSLFIRTRRPQDYLCVNREGGRQKLKDYFINEKIPREERDRQLLLAMEQQVIWVIGYRISEQFKVDEYTKRILKVQIIGGKYHE